MFSTDKSFRQAARDFGVKPSEFETFVTTKPRTLRKRYNRSPVTRKLFHEGEVHNVKQVIKPQRKRLQRVQFLEQQIQVYKTTPGFSQSEVTRRVQFGEMIQTLYTTRTYPSQIWARWSYEHNLPTSIKAIKLLYRNKRINPDDFRDAMLVWATVYGRNEDLGKVA